MKAILTFNDTTAKIPNALYNLIMKARENKLFRVPRKEIEALQDKKYKGVTISILDVQFNNEDGLLETGWAIDEYVGKWEDGETIDILYTID